MVTDINGVTAIATDNRNSNMVLAMLHRASLLAHGAPFADGLSDFGVSMLFGIEPRVFLLAKWYPYEKLEDRRANDDITPRFYPPLLD